MPASRHRRVGGHRHAGVVAVFTGADMAADGAADAPFKSVKARKEMAQPPRYALARGASAVPATGGGGDRADARCGGRRRRRRRDYEAFFGGR
jgi:hypothetical protein